MDQWSMARGAGQPQQQQQQAAHVPQVGGGCIGCRRFWRFWSFGVG